MPGADLNAVLTTPCAWVGMGGSLVCAVTIPGRGAAPAAPVVPTGPNVQEHRGGTSPVRTYQDLLTSAHDEALFEYYASSQLVTVAAATGARTPLGRPGLHAQVLPSPDGQYTLVTRLTPPYSRLVPYNDFAKQVEVWDRVGAITRTIATLPVADDVPNGGVLPGPRGFRWHPLEPATLAWAEALDGGNPEGHRPVPRSGEHAGGAVQGRAGGVPEDRVPLQRPGLDRRRAGASSRSSTGRGGGRAPGWSSATAARRASCGIAAPRIATAIRARRCAGREPRAPSRSSRAATPSSSPAPGPRRRATSPSSTRSASPRFEKARKYQMTEGYEPVVGLLSDDGSRVLTRFETRSTPPSMLVRSTADGRRVTLTSSSDPAPLISGAQKQLLTYKREDGVQLSATLYTPPGWTPAQGRLPLLLWAYPREFVDPDAAGQVTGSPQRFTGVSGASHLLLLTQGYAILDDPSMPIVGSGETANDTYVEQLVASAKAAVDTVVAMGVADPARLIVGGHSYGGFMTANLLAHSDLFRAGIARSGAYNRTLTPFGFQNEQRTFWEVPQIYARMSPFNHAHLIKEPMLLIHGEADDNSGTFPIQSERFYVALKGHGATVRYVTLPYEAHGYAARESVLHTVAEMLNWANEWTKPTTSTAQR